MSNVTLQAIGRLRRAQGRNSDTMLVCDQLEAALQNRQPVAREAPPSELKAIPEKECKVCAARKAANRARVKKHRAVKS